MKTMILLTILFCCESRSNEEWKIPDDGDRESACRTILFEVDDSSSVEDILLLKSAYKLLCDDQLKDQSSEHTIVFNEYSNYMDELNQSKSLSNQIACIDTEGYVSSNSGGGFTHRELERFYSFIDETNGGWVHSEIQTYLQFKPMLTDLGASGLSVMNEFSKSGLSIEDVNNTIQLWKLESFRNAISDVKKINGRIDPLKLKEIQSKELNYREQQNQ